MDLSDKSLSLTKKRIESLNKLGIYDTDSLLSYYPYRYDILNTKPISEWKQKDKVTFEAEVISRVSSFRKGKTTISHFQVMHQDNILNITIFNRPWARNLQMNTTLTITGIYNGGNKVNAMNYDTKPLNNHNAITPVYSTKESIQQRTIRDSISKVFEHTQNEIVDITPEQFLTSYKLLRRREAIRRIHFPENESEIQSAFRTLKYEEFLKFFVALQLNKNEEGFATYKTPKKINYDLVNQAIHALPFSLSKDQFDTLNTILKDMSDNHMMYRLVQGDVGCGKTVVAALSMYAAYTSGYQSALLAPTEILAKQHKESLQSLIADKNVKIEVLYSGLSNHEKQDILQRCQNGEIDIIVGTHSLIQEDVTFKKLGFVVADEQQRFGVEQRKALRRKGDEVDFLLMSATPIPRTLASALFGDMQVSNIHTMPQGRKEPITTLIQENSFRSVLDEVKQILDSGHQLYVICAAVEENEDYKARDVSQMAINLAKLFYPYKVSALHGRMSSEEKQAVMNDFYSNKVQVLVSTTVVEVGMNVVNATGMIIYDSDRFGLSQLHQLRGRIQRGNEVGKCWLLTDNHSKDVIERLNVLVKSNDGFEISNEDLRLRGPGDILGTRQSGLPDLILGNLLEDTNIIETAKQDAETIIHDPNNPDFVKIIEYTNQKIKESRYID